MDPTDIGLFRLAERRLAWVDQRQRLLAQNVANASTPGFKPKDLAPFASVLGQQRADLSRTVPSHLTGSTGTGTFIGAKARPLGRSPDGNEVSMEDQLGKVADTAGTQELVANIYHKYQAMFRVTLGRGG